MLLVGASQANPKPPIQESVMPNKPSGRVRGPTCVEVADQTSDSQAVEFERDRTKFIGLAKLLIAAFEGPNPDDTLGDMRVAESIISEMEDLELHLRLGFGVLPLRVDEQPRGESVCRLVLWNKPRGGGGEVHFEATIPGLRDGTQHRVVTSGMEESRAWLVGVLQSWIREAEAIVGPPPIRHAQPLAPDAKSRLEKDAYVRCIEEQIQRLIHKPSILASTVDAMNFFGGAKVRRLHEHLLPGEPFVFGYRERTTLTRTARIISVSIPGDGPQLEVPIGVKQPAKSHASEVEEIVARLRAWQRRRAQLMGIGSGELFFSPEPKPKRRSRLPVPTIDALEAGMRELRALAPAARVPVIDILRFYGVPDVAPKKFIKSTKFVAREGPNKAHQLPRTSAGLSRGRQGGQFKSEASWTRDQVLSAAEGWMIRLGAEPESPF